MYIHIVNTKTGKSEYTFLKTELGLKRAKEILKKEKKDLKIVEKEMVFVK